MPSPDPDTLPSREPDGEFATFARWVDKASSWIGGTNAYCADAKGRRCLNGGDMMRARDEGAFPVRFWFGKGGQAKSTRRASMSKLRTEIIKQPLPTEHEAAARVRQCKEGET